MSYTGDFDYQSGPFVALFEPGQNISIIRIPVFLDNMVEMLEMFSVSIDSVSLPSKVKIGGTPNASVTIQEGKGIFTDIVSLLKLCLVVKISLLIHVFIIHMYIHTKLCFT